MGDTWGRAWHPGEAELILLEQGFRVWNGTRDENMDASDWIVMERILAAKMEGFQRRRRNELARLFGLDKEKARGR